MTKTKKSKEERDPLAVALGSRPKPDSWHENNRVHLAKLHSSLLPCDCDRSSESDWRKHKTRCPVFRRHKKAEQKELKNNS